MNNEQPTIDYESNAPRSLIAPGMKFDRDERYILSFYEGGSMIAHRTVAVLHVAVAILFAYGVAHRELSLMVTSFVMVILWRAYESSHQPRYFRATQSVLRKYAERVNAFRER